MNSAPTFSFALKEELASLNRSPAALRALLSGYVKAGGSLRFVSGEPRLTLSSESSKVATALFKAIKDLYPAEPYFSYTRESGFAHRVRYHVNLSIGLEPFMHDLMVSPLDETIPPYAFSSKEESVSYATGCFLSSGYVTSPTSTHYHLEIALVDGAFARNLQKLLNKNLLRPFSFKLTERRQQYVIYLKKSQDIADFLACMGASEATLEFENARMERDMHNVSNRWNNLDGANMGKTLKASEKQKEQILYLKEHGGLTRLASPKLEALCKLRLEHEDASLSELAELLSEELASEVTKSNVNHLFRKLEEIYKKTCRG